MAHDTSNPGAKVAAIAGLTFSLPAFALGWVIAWGVLTYGLPSSAGGQMAMPFARELAVWGLIEAGGGTIAIILGVIDWRAGRCRSAAWWFWAPALVAAAGLILLLGFVLLQVQARTPRA